MINFNNIYVLVVLGILIIAMVYNGIIFIYFMYLLFFIILLNSLYLIWSKDIRVEDLTLNNFNNATQNGMMGIVNLILSILGFLYFYNNYGF